MAKLILMRHGQSCWNLNNLFTGWVDIPLSTQGIDEALKGGQRLKNEVIDVIFTSTLVRALMTAMLAMSVNHTTKVPVISHAGESKLEEWSRIYSPLAEEQTIPVLRAWELNERMYGKLQGVNKAELAEQFGAEQVQIWRRSYDIAPPEGESLKMTAARSIPYFQQYIVPYLEQEKNVFVVAHGNSLRSIMMLLDQLSEEEVVSLELATGLPVIYQYTDGNFIKQN